MSQYIIYCRKSTESEERQVLSIESQIDEVKAEAARSNVAVSEVLKESQSAKQPGRPVFNAMVKRILKGEIKGILCWKLDRLARNPIDGASLIWALDQGKLTEIITPGRVYQNSSIDKFMMQIDFGIAKKYVDDLSDNVKRGLRAKLDRGWLPGLPPLGYLNEPIQRTIVKDPERFSMVRKVWDLLLTGTMPSDILDIANKRWGLKTRVLKRLGGKPLALSAIYKIFSDPFYYGLIERKEGTYPGKHEPMITEKEYWKAQETLGRKGRPRSKKHQFAFTGMIQCGECGCMITAEEKYNRFGSHYVYYRCTKKNRKHPCSQSYINLKNLEAQVLEYLKKIHIPESLLTIAMEYLESEAKENERGKMDIQRSLEKALGDCQKRIDNLNQMRLKDMVNDEEYLSEKRKLIEEKTRIEKNSINGDENREKALTLTVNTLLFSNQAEERFQNGSLERQRNILQAIGSNLFLKDKKLVILAEKPFRILENDISGLNDDFHSLEPGKNGSTKRKTGGKTPALLSVCSRREDVRTLKALVRKILRFFEQSKKHFEIPTFGEASEKFQKVRAA